MDSWSRVNPRLGLTSDKAPVDKQKACHCNRTFSGGRLCTEPFCEEPVSEGQHPARLLCPGPGPAPAGFGQLLVTGGSLLPMDRKASFFEKSPGCISSFRVCLRWYIYFIFLVKKLSPFFKIKLCQFPENGMTLFSGAHGYGYTLCTPCGLEAVCVKA